MSTTVLPAARRHRSRLVRTEATLFRRDPVGLVWGMLAPLIAIVVLGAFPATRDPAKELHGLSYFSAYLPIITVFSMSMLALNGLPPVLGTYRERGVLRRLATTPVSPVALLRVQVLLHFTAGALTSIVLLVVARFGYHVALPQQFFGFVVTYALAAAALLGIGVFVAAVAPSAKVANAVGAMLFFPMMFFAGLWLPRAQMPSALRHISDYTPLGATVQAMQDATQGQFPGALQLGVLAAYAVMFGALAVRMFRWE
ncbi:MAG: ABC transporter permease [Jatrophihabitans sp.]